jgi:hypothetical protein
MAYGTGRISNSNAHGTWFQEQQTLINSVSDAELNTLGDEFDKKFETAAETMARSYNGLNIMRDAKRMMENPTIMEQYKKEFLDPIIQEIKEYPVNSDSEKLHMESVAQQLSEAWDQSQKAFIT